MRCLLLLLPSGSPLSWEMLSLTATTISAVGILWRAIANLDPSLNHSVPAWITPQKEGSSPIYLSEMNLNLQETFYWANDRIFCRVSLCLVNVCCSFEWQNSLTQEVLELLIKAEHSLNEQENSACKHSMDLWHSSICNFRKAMSLYPLAFYKEGWNLKLDGST